MKNNSYRKFDLSDDKSFVKTQKELKNALTQKIKSCKKVSSLVLVITGEGKGKTTSAIGNIIRARGHGLKCCLFQFFKGQVLPKEIDILKDIGVDVFNHQGGCFWNENNPTQIKQQLVIFFNKVQETIKNSSYDLIVLDEATYLLTSNFINVYDFIEILKQRPNNTSIIITGRYAPQELIDFADTVTTLNNTKHAFDNGIAALKGIDY